MSKEIIIVIVLLVFSGLFSASETALITLTPAKVRTLVNAKRPGSTYLAKLKKQHHKTLITILVGNNFVNIAAASLTTVLMTEYFGSAAVGLATGILTIVILVFGEVVPKSLATSYAKEFALLVSPLLYWLGIVLTPIIWLLDNLVKILLKLLGSKKQKQVTEEELIAMAAIGEEEGAIDEHERELIENVLEFNDIRVEEIMTPRVHMEAVPENYNLKDATQFITHHTFSRLPVYRDNIDNIVGILSVKELIKYLHKEDKPKKNSLRKIELQKPVKVRRSMRIHNLLLKFKSQRTHIAIVIDEDGKTAGLITMEDLLEELVGEIEDENDNTKENIREIKEGTYELSARTELDELSDFTGLAFEYPEYKTLNFILIEQLGRLPKKGEKITIEDWVFTVTKMWRHTILTVKLRKIEPKKKS